MNFEDHEIWNRPVPDAGTGEQPVVERTAAPVSSGRLYASAGAPAHPDAIVALPHHTRTFVSVAELPEEPIVEPPAQSAELAASAEAAQPAPSAPMAPPAPIINDPAIAEVLAPPTAAVMPTSAPAEEPPSFDWAKSIEVKPEPLDAFKDWFADDAPATASVPAAAPDPVKTGLAAQQLTDAATRARTQLQDLGGLVTASGDFDLRKYSLIAFAVTAVVAVVDAFLGGTLGLLFGIGLVASTAFGAFKLRDTDRWAGWVMPAYVAIAAILVAGPFTSGSAGFSIVGQILLVGTTLISVAPWLAAATAIGALAPRFRKR